MTPSLLDGPVTIYGNRYNFVARYVEFKHLVQIPFHSSRESQVLGCDWIGMNFRPSPITSARKVDVMYVDFCV